MDVNDVLFERAKNISLDKVYPELVEGLEKYFGRVENYNAKFVVDTQ